MISVKLFKNILFSRVEREVPENAITGIFNGSFHNLGAR
jgi:hypothetical protein